MSDKNANVERKLAEASRVLEQCKQRRIDPVKTLERAVKQHDSKNNK